jgi:hypothetical protein
MIFNMLIKSKSLDAYSIFYLLGKTFVSSNYILSINRKDNSEFGLVHSNILFVHISHLNECKNDVRNAFRKYEKEIGLR